MPDTIFGTATNRNRPTAVSTIPYPNRTGALHVHAPSGHLPPHGVGEEPGLVEGLADGVEE